MELNKATCFNPALYFTTPSKMASFNYLGYSTLSVDDSTGTAPLN